MVGVESRLPRRGKTTVAPGKRRRAPRVLVPPGVGCPAQHRPSKTCCLTLSYDRGRNSLLASLRLFRPRRRVTRIEPQLLGRGMDGLVTRGGGKARGTRLALPRAMDVKRLRRMDLKPSAVPSSVFSLVLNYLVAANGRVKFIQ